MISAVVLIVEDLISSLSNQSNFNIDHDIHAKFREASVKLKKQFYCLKLGLLKILHRVSSLREKIQNMPLNFAFGKAFVDEISHSTKDYVKDLRKDFQQKIAEIQKLPEEVQGLVYAKFKGAIQFDMQVEKCFAAIRPWVENWVEVQVSSILQREIFAPSRENLEDILAENKNRMVAGFKELMASKILEPLIQLEELKKLISEEIELVSFSCNI